MSNFKRLTKWSIDFHGNFTRALGHDVDIAGSVTVECIKNSCSCDDTTVELHTTIQVDKFVAVSVEHDPYKEETVNCNFYDGIEKDQTIIRQHAIMSLINELVRSFDAVEFTDFKTTELVKHEI
jgi:hypothetical protein